MLNMTLTQLTPTLYEIESIPAMTIFDGMTYLIELDKAFQKELVSGNVTLTIRDHLTNEEKYVDFFPLGKGLASELLTYIERKLAQTYPDRVAERESLMDELSDALMESMTSLPSVPSLTRCDSNSYDVVTSKPIVPVTKKKRSFKPLINVGYGFLVVLLLIGSYVGIKEGVGFFKASVSVSKKENPKNKPLDYFEQAEKDGSEASIRGIEEQLLADKEFDLLREFNEKYPSPEGSFDLAFHDKQWKEVLNTPLPFFSTDRQKMMTYAHIQLGTLSKDTTSVTPKEAVTHLKEARQLNETLKDDALTVSIDTTTFFNGLYLLEEGKIKEAEAIKSMITHPDYPELLATAKILVERINALKEEKKTEDAENWATVLSTIGREYREKDDN